MVQATFLCDIAPISLSWSFFSVINFPEQRDWNSCLSLFCFYQKYKKEHVDASLSSIVLCKWRCFCICGQCMYLFLQSNGLHKWPCKGIHLFPNRCGRSKYGQYTVGKLQAWTQFSQFSEQYPEAEEKKGNIRSTSVFVLFFPFE